MSVRLIVALQPVQVLDAYSRFCGKITSIDHDPAKQTATVHFEKPSAAKTALMLNGGSLDGATLSVTSEQEHPDERPTSAGNGAHIEQSDKPRAASTPSVPLPLPPPHALTPP